MCNIVGYPLPESGTVQNIIDGFINYVINLLKESDVYVVFDRYYEYRIKSVTRCERAGQVRSKQHQINPNMPLQSQKIL